jgi:hypothetical protein
MMIFKTRIDICLLLLISCSVCAQDIVDFKSGRKVRRKNKHYQYFSDNASVTMADGSSKVISDIKIGENIKTCRNGKTMTTQVKQVEVFEKPTSSLTAVYLRPADRHHDDNQPLVPALLIEATPHHMVQTGRGKKKMKKLVKNDILFHYEPKTGVVSNWKVGLIKTKVRKVNKAYNIETEEGTYLVANMVMAQ